MVLILCLLMLASGIARAEIYRWVDEEGKVRFSDRVPPEAAKLERHVLDARGNLRDVLSRQRTLEELTLHRNRLRAMASEAERRKRQDEYDQYLWTSFDDLQQIEDLRTERMEIRDGQLLKARDNLEFLQRSLKQEQKRKTDRVLAQQNLIRGLEEDISRLEEQVKQLQSKRSEEFEGLSKDMRRYEYLRLKRAVEDRPLPR